MVFLSASKVMVGDKLRRLYWIYGWRQVADVILDVAEVILDVAEVILFFHRNKGTLSFH